MGHRVGAAGRQVYEPGRIFSVLQQAWRRRRGLLRMWRKVPSEKREVQTCEVSRKAQVQKGKERRRLFKAWMRTEEVQVQRETAEHPIEVLKNFFTNLFWFSFCLLVEICRQESYFNCVTNELDKIYQLDVKLFTLFINPK